jgi:hypothetical protein
MSIPTVPCAGAAPADLATVRPIRDEIRSRVEALIGSLGITASILCPHE